MHLSVVALRALDCVSFRQVPDARFSYKYMFIFIDTNVFYAWITLHICVDVDVTKQVVSVLSLPHTGFGLMITTIIVCAAAAAAAICVRDNNNSHKVDREYISILYIYAVE